MPARENSVTWFNLEGEELRTLEITMVQPLLQAGANVNHADGDGTTALMIAASGHNTDVTQVLLLAGANVHLGDKDGKCALISAAEKGRVGNVKALLEAGAHFDTALHNGQTVLMCARPHIDVMKVLLEAGADCNRKDKQGNSALSVLKGRPGRQERVALLQEHGATR
jgi:ankyrin repeat protein